MSVFVEMARKREAELKNLVNAKNLGKQENKEEEGIENFEDFKKNILNNFELFFRNYLKLFFKVTEGRKLQENWHLDLIGYNVKKILAKENFRDIWNMSPGSGKSSISIALATLYMGFYPNTRLVMFSETKDVRDKYARCIRKMLESDIELNLAEDEIDFPSYKMLFPNVNISENRNRQDEFYIKDYAGSVRIMSLGATKTGIDADFIIVDDPIDYSIMKEQGFAYIEKNNKTVSYLLTRLRDMTEPKAFVAVMQRMCEGDTTEHLLNSTKSQNWNLVVIPAKENRNDFIYLGKQGMCYDYYNKSKIFREFNSIFLDYKKEDWLVKQKEIFSGNGIDFEYQYLQMSNGIQENIFNLGKIRQYKDIDYSKSYTKIMSIDTATGIDTGDAHAISLWLMDDERNLYLYKMFYSQKPYDELLRFCRDLRDTECIDITLIENRTVGQSLIQAFEKDLYGRPCSEKERRDRHTNPRNPIVSIKTPTSKEDRASEANTYIEIGKIFFPEKLNNYTELKNQPKTNVLDCLLRELKHFPTVKHDDGVDSVSQCINYVKARFATKREKSFKNKIYVL